jgi:hypothetical protein
MRASCLLPFLVASPLFFGATTAHAQRARGLAGPNEAYVLIDGPSAAMLERQDGDRWARVCAAPCDRPQPIGRTYRIAGDDVRETAPFVLEGKPGETVTLHFSETKHKTGSSLVQAGVIVTLLGGLTFIGSVFGSCSESGGDEACTTYKWLTYTGGAIAVVGVATIVSGIVLMAQGSKATVDQKSARVFSLPIAQSEPFSARFRVEPERSKPSLQAAPTTPIFTFTF